MTTGNQFPICLKQAYMMTLKLNCPFRNLKKKFLPKHFYNNLIQFLKSGPKFIELLKHKKYLIGEIVCLSSSPKWFPTLEWYKKINCFNFISLHC